MPPVSGWVKPRDVSQRFDALVFEGVPSRIPDATSFRLRGGSFERRLRAPSNDEILASRTRAG